MGCRLFCLTLWAAALRSSGLPEPLHPVDTAAPAVSMFQVRANAVEAKTRRAPKTEGQRPWELYRYFTCGHHKAGVDLARSLMIQVFKALDLNMTKDFGTWNFLCDGSSEDLFCYNREAPVRFESDTCSLESVQKEHAAYPEQLMRVANSVRDPLDMVASAYCFHHRGMEWIYPEWGGLEVMKMGLHEGVPFMAQKMLDVVANMTSFHENPQVKVHALPFEIISATSAGFDAEVEKLIDFWFHGLITEEERKKAIELARMFDLHRYPKQDSGHTNDPECMMAARAATQFIEPQLLGQYQAFQRKLGYKVT